MITSKLNKIVFWFLIPTILSLHHLSTNNTDQSVVWLRYWIVLSCIVLLETLYDTGGQGQHATDGQGQHAIGEQGQSSIGGQRHIFLTIVIVTILLSPRSYNPADLIFDYLLLPLYQVVTLSCSHVWAMMNTVERNPGYYDNILQFFHSVGSNFNLDLEALFFQKIKSNPNFVLMNIFSSPKEKLSPRLFSNLIKEILYGKKIVKKNRFFEVLKML